MLVHVEVEQQWRTELARRVYEYATAAHLAYRLPVVSVVVLLHGPAPSSPAVYRVSALGRQHVVEFEVVSLASLDAHEMRKRLPPEGWPFLAAMRGADDELLQSVARDLASRGDVPAERKSAVM